MKLDELGYFPQITIIVAVYNGEETIEDCLISLLALDYPIQKREIIIVDNASTDDTREILARYEPQIRCLYQPKRGPAAARNYGIAHSQGEVIVLTDADCVVSSTWLREIVQPLQDSSVAIVGGKILSKQPCNTIEIFGEKIHDHQRAITEDKIPYVITMNWAARRSLLEELCHFDESFLRGSDSEFSLRLLSTSYKCVYVPNAIIYHQNESTLMGLFQEGYIHGFYSNKVLKAHHLSVKTNGHCRFNWKSYQKIVNSLKNFIFDLDDINSLCDFVFNLGKKIGKFFGSIRYMYIDI